VSLRAFLVLTAATLLVVAIADGRSTWAAGGAVRLYVTNSLGDDITVIDLGALKAVDDIKVGAGVHGACVPADGRWLFTTVESEDNLKVISTATDKVVKTIALTGRPNQCASTPDGRFVGVPIRNRDRVDIVDVTLGRVVKTLPVKAPHNCCNAGNNGEMFVSSMGDHQILRIDLRTMDYAERISVGGIPRPYAVSRDGKVLYSALTDFHGFVIASVAENRVLDRVELPPAPPSTCALEPRTPTHGLEISPDGKEVWATSLADGGVYVYEIGTRELSNEIPTGKCPNWITFSPDGKYCCVSNSGSDDCSIIDTQSRREVARIPVGKGPKRLVAVKLPSTPPGL
jgi:YVTN family beta-propeller protein